MARGDAGPSTITLRFKHGKTTVLLFTEPLAPFTNIKADLLSMLRERYPNGLPSPPHGPAGNIPIPTSILDVVLGVLVDEYDSTKGWNEIDTRGAAAMRESPKSLGIKDGDSVAFAFTSDDVEEEPDFWVEYSDVNALYPDQLD